MKNCELNASNFIKLCRCCSWYSPFFSSSQRACMRSVQSNGSSTLNRSIFGEIKFKCIQVAIAQQHIDLDICAHLNYEMHFGIKYTVAEHSVAVLFKCVSIFIPFVHGKHTRHSSKMHFATMSFFNLILKKTHTHLHQIIRFSRAEAGVCICASP